MSNLNSLFLNSIQGSVPFSVNILLKTPFPLFSYFWTYHLNLILYRNVIFFFGCPTSPKHFFIYCFPLYFALSYNIVYYSFRGRSFNPFFYRNHLSGVHSPIWSWEIPELTRKTLRARCQTGMHGIRSLFTAPQLTRLDDNNDDNDDDSFMYL